MYDPKYKMKYRPPRIERLLKWGTYVPHMAGDPEIEPRRGEEWWDARCRVLYEHAMALKHGDITKLIPHTGLWFHACADKQKCG